jgi:hypothetical protein
MTPPNPKEPPILSSLKCAAELTKSLTYSDIPLRDFSQAPR